MFFKGLIFICFGICSLNAYSQDSLNLLPVTSNKDTVILKKRTSIKPTANLDQRFSLIGSNKDVNIWGYRIGVIVNDKYRVGFGGYVVNINFDSSVAKTRVLTNNFTKVSQVNQKMNFGTVYITPYLIRKKLWKLGLLFELGYGQVIIDSFSVVKRFNSTGKVLLSTSVDSKTGKEPIVPIGTGLTLNVIAPDIKGLHFLSYLGINSIIGIRTVIVETDFKQNYDGFFWSIGGVVYIDRIFADLSKKKKPVASIAK